VPIPRTGGNDEGYEAAITLEQKELESLEKNGSLTISYVGPGLQCWLRFEDLLTESERDALREGQVVRMAAQAAWLRPFLDDAEPDIIGVKLRSRPKG
jgi:hypothetical protein